MKDADVFVILRPKLFTELVLLEAHGDLNGTFRRLYLYKLSVFTVGSHKAYIIEENASCIERSRIILVITGCKLVDRGIIFRSALYRSYFQLCVIRYS